MNLHTYNQENGKKYMSTSKRVSSGEFAEQILADLISQGYNGNELLIKFKEMQKKIRPSVEKMLAEAKEAADGKGEFFDYESVFGAEE